MIDLSTLSDVGIPGTLASLAMLMFLVVAWRR
jgi:hypothetical protein